MVIYPRPIVRFCECLFAEGILVRERTAGTKMKQLSAAEDGAVWGVNNGGQVRLSRTDRIL